MSTRRNLLVLSAAVVSIAVGASATGLAQKAGSERKIGGPDTFPAHKGGSGTFPAHKGTTNPAFKQSDKAIKGGPSPDMRAYPTKKGKRAYPQGTK